MHRMPSIKNNDGRTQMAICTDAKEPSFDEKNPDKVDKIIVCQKTQIAPQLTHWSLKPKSNPINLHENVGKMA